VGEAQDGARTRLHAYNVLQAVLNRAVIWDAIPFSPTAKISSDDLPRAKRPDSHVLSESELSILLAEARNPTSRSRSRGYVGAYSSFFPAIACAAYTGARRGETLAIRWSEISLDFKTVTISGSLSDPSEGLAFKEQKNGRSRTISISESLVTILRSHRAAQASEKLQLGPAYRDDDLAFCQPDGSALKPSKFGDAFTHLVDRSGVPRIRLHDLRDTHASLLAKKGIPIQVISTRLGHSSIGVTFDRYITMYRDQDDAAALAFESLVG
jgi:integrase